METLCQPVGSSSAGAPSSSGPAFLCLPDPRSVGFSQGPEGRGAQRGRALFLEDDPAPPPPPPGQAAVRMRRRRRGSRRSWPGTQRVARSQGTLMHLKVCVRAGSEKVGAPPDVPAPDTWVSEITRGLSDCILSPRSPPGNVSSTCEVQCFSTKVPR